MTERPPTNVLPRLRRAALGAAIAVPLAFGGCAWKQERDQARAEKQQVIQEKQKLEEQVQTASAETVEMNATLDEVQQSLEELRVKELKAIRSSIEVAQEGKGKNARRQQLQAELKTIRDTIHQNLAKLAKLEKENKQKGTQMASLRKLADELKRSLEEKESMVAEMDGKIRGLSQTVEQQAGVIKEREDTIQQRDTTIDERTKELNKGYVAVADKKLLKEKGIVAKKGSVLGLGGSWLETGKFDPEVFREIDTTKEMEVPLTASAKKVQVLSEHPKDSYQLVDAGPNASTLKVTDASAFWKGSKYLVVMTPKANPPQGTEAGH